MAKRLAQTAFNWSALSERVPPHQRQQFNLFKALSESYLQRVLAYPETAPKIDWSFYEKTVPVSGMVVDFKNKYEALKVPYPKDTVSSKIDEQEKVIKVEIENFKKESNSRIEEYKKQLAHLQSLLPFDQMTMEDFRDAYPDTALDPINRPTFWPHLPEDQPGYDSKEESHGGH